MTQRQQTGVMMVLVALVAIFGTLVVHDWVSPPSVQAQVTGPGQSGYITALTGAVNDRKVPLFLVDSKAQSVTPTTSARIRNTPEQIITQPGASPSMPSVRFTALLEPTIVTTVMMV